MPYIPVEIGHILPNVVVMNLSSNAFLAMLPQYLLCSKSLNLWMSVTITSREIPLPCPGYEEPLSSLVFFGASSNHFSGSLEMVLSQIPQVLSGGRISSVTIHHP